MATAGDSAPSTGDQRTLLGMPPMSCGLKTQIGPVRARTAAVSVKMSALLDVTTTGAGRVHDDPAQQR